MKRGGATPTTGKKREGSGGGARRAEAGTQTEDVPLRGGATDAARGGVGRCASGEETASLGAAWRARVRAAMAVLAAVVDEEGGATVAGDATVMGDATVAIGAADASVAPIAPGCGAGESDEAAEARLRRELGCLGSGSEEEDEAARF